jgi:LacI family transcriptional regulator
VVYRLLQGDIPTELLDPSLPVVFIESHDRTHCNRVNFDPEPGLRAAVAHLAALGHRELASITISRRELDRDLLRDFDFPDRQRMLRLAAQEHGLALHERQVDPHQFVPANDYQTYPVQVIQAALETQLVLPPAATAIVAGNDDLALALYHSFAKRGIRVPHDLSVVGFDDMYAAHVAVPSLTTVSHELMELGRVAGEQVIALVDAPSLSRGPVHLRIPSRLVQRESTAPPAGAAR